ncbi:hypothetical protein AUP74_02427 [Microbulbifer aggregans]|uniref:Uncharacterized protein n=1 Tax=Microbulbifer aggregans TaxID=1769779 RepID=A0A1C9W9J4_9GAMM|nr:hypothetical protein [Microbulbifer aggregans]AOS97829.1 hypothetical protein AUP74_02427 [Microbulbifer aggregans]
MQEELPSTSFVRFVAVLHRPTIFWWPFPFMRPEEGRRFGKFRLFTCGMLYPLFLWSVVSLILFLKKGMGIEELWMLFPAMSVTFFLYFALVAYCWDRVHTRRGH